MWTVVCYHEKTKTSDRNDLIVGTVVVLNTALKCTDFGFKRSWAQGQHFKILHQLSTGFPCILESRGKFQNVRKKFSRPGKS